MTAGTVVITGGVLATVILLCIIAVLCYCRLQYYCCKRDGSEVDTGDPQPHSAAGLDGSAVALLSLPSDPPATPGFCPTCTPLHGVRNGGFVPGHYQNTHSTALGMAALLNQQNQPDFITNTHAISTDV